MPNMKFLLLALCLLTTAAGAAIPDVFQPVVVTPPFSFSTRLIDLTPAFEKAKQGNRPILIYLGAADCPPCKNYSQFLEAHKAELQGPLSEVVLVDIRTWLKGPALTFQIYDRRYSVSEFLRRTGDTRRWASYPWWWLLDSDGVQIRQLPTDSSAFLTVEGHKRLIAVP